MDSLKRGAAGTGHVALKAIVRLSAYYFVDIVAACTDTGDHPVILDLPFGGSMLPRFFKNVFAKSPRSFSFVDSAIALLATAIICCAPHSRLLAQSDANTQSGLTPFGSYDVGSIDRVSLANGGLTLDIPLISYPQRGGKLKLALSIHYRNEGSHATQICINGVPCQWSWLPNPIGFYIRDAQNVNEFATTEKSTSQPPQQYYVLAIESSDGGSHFMGPVLSTGYESVDATAFHYDTSSKIVTDADGIRYQEPTGADSYGCPGCISPLREDPNGNEISYSSSAGWKDTMGRIIPVLVLPASGCQTWNPPGVNDGSYPVKFCTIAVPTQIGYGQGSSIANIVELQSITLPNGRAWTFQYNSTGDLAKVTTPEGGSISYTYADIQFCEPVGTVLEMNRSVISRTVTGSNSATWTYNYSPNLETNVNLVVVTDPTGNDVVHTNTGGCGLYETKTQYYQGSKASGTLLKTVNTTYNLSSPSPFPYPDLAGVPVNVVPLSVTTIWANGSENQTTYGYDSGFTYTNPNPYLTGTFQGLYGKVLEKHEYDYG